MQPSSDSGHSAAKTFMKIVVFCLLFLGACNRPSKMSFFDSTPGKGTSPGINEAGADKHLIKKTGKKRLYLTFDDGPNKGTSNVLTIIQSEKVPVAFFIIGEHIYASRNQRRSWNDLHTATDVVLCNHGYTHAWHNNFVKYYNYPDSVVNDFKRSGDSLLLANNIIRAPGRNIWRIDSMKFTDLKSSNAAADSLSKAGFEVMGWDVEWPYNPKTLRLTYNADELLNFIDSTFKHNKTRQKDHLVLLAHDQVYTRSKDSAQLRQFLQKLKQKDEYELSVITNYPGITKRLMP